MLITPTKQIIHTKSFSRNLTKFIVKKQIASVSQKSGPNWANKWRGPT